MLREERERTGARRKKTKNEEIETSRVVSFLPFIYPLPLPPENPPPPPSRSLEGGREGEGRVVCCVEGRWKKGTFDFIKRGESKYRKTSRTTNTLVDAPRSKEKGKRK